MRIINHSKSRLNLVLGLVVLGGLWVVPGLGMASEKMPIGEGVVQGDPGDALEISLILYQEDPRDGLDEPQKPLCGEPEDGLDFILGDPVDGLDCWLFQGDSSDILWGQCVTAFLGWFCIP